jgi:acyl carrier protein
MVLMDVERELLQLLDEVLSLHGRALKFDRRTHLLGAIPELDSMAVVSLVTQLEERFEIAIDDDDIDGSTFASVGSLLDFVRDKLSAAA